MELYQRAIDTFNKHVDPDITQQGVISAGSDVVVCTFTATSFEGEYECDKTALEIYTAVATNHKKVIGIFVDGTNTFQFDVTRVKLNELIYKIYFTNVSYDSSSFLIKTLQNTSYASTATIYTMTTSSEINVGT